MSNPSATAQIPHPPFHPENLSARNSFGLPCMAAHVLSIKSENDLSEHGLMLAGLSRCWVLGSGSNVILPPSIDEPLMRVCIPGIGQPVLSPDALEIEVGAGESWHGWVSHTVRMGWGGLENLALIPGTVGAAPVQNIGAYGVELDQRICRVTAWHVPTARSVTLDASECGFAYRDSIFKRAHPGTWVIMRVRFRLPLPWKPALDYPDLRDHPVLRNMPLAEISPQHVFDAVCEIRRRKLPDPAVLGNAGSFFKNPVISASQRDALAMQFPALVSYPQADGRFKLAAGWMIEQCGWKGRRIGKVGMHEKQALVMVNEGGASASDVLNLAREVQQSVRARFSVELEMEPQLIGASQVLSEA